MSSPELAGHLSAVEGLWRAAVAGRLPHALLFRGPAGVGKFLAARVFAQGLFCAPSVAGRAAGTVVAPCGTCGPCKRVVSGNHPDLFVVDAAAHGQDQITIHFVSHRDERPKDAYQGQALEDFLALRALEGGYRVVLVRESERMNEAAQNALLKILEEPAGHTILVLETSLPAALLATVRSRTTDVQLGPLAEDEVRAILARELEDPGDLDLLVELSSGSPGRALQLEARGAVTMRVLLEEVLTGARSERGAADKLWEIDGEFPAKTPRASVRLRAATFLDLGLALMLAAERAAARGAGSGLAAAFLGASRARRRWCMDQWMRARQDVELNLSPEAIVERALYALHPEAALERGKR